MATTAQDCVCCDAEVVPGVQEDTLSTGNNANIDQNKGSSKLQPERKTMHHLFVIYEAHGNSTLYIYLMHKNNLPLKLPINRAETTNYYYLCFF